MKKTENKKELNILLYIFIGSCIGAPIGLLAYIKDWI